MHVHLLHVDFYAHKLNAVIRYLCIIKFHKQITTVIWGLLSGNWPYPSQTKNSK